MCRALCKQLVTQRCTWLGPCPPGTHRWCRGFQKFFWLWLLVRQSFCFVIKCTHTLEKAMAPHSSALAWKIAWTGAWWAAVHGVTKSRTWLSDFTFTFHFHALEKEMATRSSVLAWRIPGTGEPGGVPSMGSHRVGHDWSDLAAAAATHTHTLYIQNQIQSHATHTDIFFLFLPVATYHLGFITY